jgi:ferric-dicitrate binding protein FerR (iron transport regulator)
VDKYLDLIAKRLSNEISDDELRELQDWLEESKENELMYHRIADAWHGARYQPRVKGQERVFKKISAQLGLPDEHEYATSRQRTSAIPWARLAAVFVIALGLVGLWSYLKPTGKHDQIAEVPKVIVQSNPKGQKSTVTLPDGTKVRLNSESYIEYRDNFASERHINLVGEAFFEVVRDTLHPFVVNSGGVMVRVLGTSFNVQAFPFDDSMSVAVVTGKVLVERKNNHQESQQGVLLPAEMVRIDHKTGRFEKSGYDPDELIAWKDDVLAFNQASFDEIVDRLERWYGVKFVIRRSAPITDGFTGHYKNPSLKVVLEGMSFSSDFKFQIKRDTVMIY